MIAWPTSAAKKMTRKKRESEFSLTNRFARVMLPAQPWLSPTIAKNVMPPTRIKPQITIIARTARI